MNTMLKYSTIFLWAVLFLYIYNKLMSKTILYPIMGFLILFISITVIQKLFELKKGRNNIN